MEEDRFAVFFEDGTDTHLTSGQISQLSTDFASWCRFLSMVAGGKPASMLVDRGPHRIKVVAVERQNRNSNDVNL